jgi:glycosyltransferase involved in cell wall biosynthesis
MGARRRTVDGETVRETGRDERPRVAVVAPTLDILGGQSIQADWLVSRLRDAGVDAELVPVNPRLPGPLAWLQRVKYLRTLLTEILYVWRLLKRLRRADVVHVFSASYLSFVLAPTPAVLVAGKLYGKPVVLHYHSGEAEDHVRRWRRTARPVLRMADRVVVPSRFLVEVFDRFDIEAEAIQNFIAEDFTTYRRRETPRPVFLANRNLEPMYNVACVLRAFARIRERRPDARLLVAGDGSQRRGLEALARDLDLEGVRFLGQVPPERMGALYDEADIFLNASSIDNQPLSILESFAAGLPVVTTEAGGIPHLVRHGENGLMVPLDDDGSLAEQALRLLEEPGLAAELTSRARREYRELYRWESVRDQWKELYRQLLERPIRVTLVAPSTRILGGQAVQAERLMEGLREVSRVEASILHVNPLLPRGLRWLQRIKFVRTLVTETLYVAYLLWNLRHTDVVHVFSASYFSFLLAPTPALLVSRLYGKKTALNYRSGEAKDHLQRWGRTAIPTIRLADRLVVGSGYLIDVFEDFDLPAVAIPNIVETDRYTFRRREPLRPVFMGNRNLEPHYDVATILRAFRRVQDVHPEAELLLAGDGSQREHLESLADELELEGVTFLGRVEPDEMPRVYDRADIYLNASRIDNMPTSLIEAFAAGLPVVTTSAGGIPYIVRHEENGLLVPPGDDERLAEEALRLLREPELACRLVETGRRECEERYVWPVVRDRWVTLYSRLGAGSLSSAAAPESERVDRGVESPEASPAWSPHTGAGS